MKRDELLSHAKCGLCHKPIGASGLPLFWKVTVERFGIDLRAVQRQDGMGVFMGNQALAAVMGPNEDLATPMQDKPAVVTVCESCGTKSTMVAILAEAGQA